MEWKSPAELMELLQKMKDKTAIIEKCSYPAFFVHGNMFVGVHGDKLFLRLSDADMVEIKKDCKDVRAQPIRQSNERLCDLPKFLS
jgi:hypothetical protein